jgi:hypothetical protein
MVIAFDVDNTLLIERDGKVVVNEDVRNLMVAIYNLGLADVVVWSGGGAGYAEYATRDCGIKHMVDMYWGKGEGYYPDISIDDMEANLATINLRLKGDIIPTPWMGHR